MNIFANHNIVYDCRECHDYFYSKNVLYIHLKSCLLKFLAKSSDLLEIVFFDAISSINFSTNVFIDINIIESENMTINVNTLIINSCDNMKIVFFATKESFVKRIIMCAIATIVSAHINMKISIALRNKNKLLNRDFIFYLKQNNRLEHEEKFFAHIMNSRLSNILITNSTSNSITIFKRFRLDIVKVFEKISCYIASHQDAHFATNN